MSTSRKPRVSRVYLCDPLVFGGHEEALQQIYTEFFSGLDGLELRVPDFGNQLIRVDVRPQNYIDRRYLARHSKMPVTAYEGVPAVKVSGTWNVPDHVDAQQRRAYAVFEIEEVGVKLMTALSLYLPGSSRSNYAHTLRERDGRVNFACYSVLAECTEYMVSKGIAPQPRLSIEDFLNWLSQRQGFWTGKPVTNLDRAICYLSHAHHLTHKLTQVDDFVWVMGGIEALFASGREPILEQLRRRISLFMPESVGLFSRKSLNDLYQFRSRFLHGQLPIPNTFTELPDDDPDLFAFERELDIAGAILIKSIHKCAEMGLSSLEFVESVKEHKQAGS